MPWPFRPAKAGKGAAAAEAEAAPFPSGIELLHSPARGTIDIVFVHGLHGDRVRTWTAQGAAAPWPATLLPDELKTARVLTFGYDALADWLGPVSQNRIADHGWNLLTSLAGFRDRDGTDGRPIIFVCHSLGGLVCEEALVRARERPEPHLQSVLGSTRAIAFLGTPHHGADLASWAAAVSRVVSAAKQMNGPILGVLRRNSEVLARIQDSFHTVLRARAAERPIDITCFHEELPLPGVGLVVPQESALLPGYIQIGIRKNHRDMTKFASPDDPGFEALCGELRRWSKNVDSAAPGVPQAIDAGGRQDGPSGQEAPAAHFLVPYTSNDCFVGRFGIIEQLERGLGHDPAAGGTSQPRAALYGLGGIGKTQIALQYLYLLRRAHPDVSVFWVHASSAERFQQAYASIAAECQIPGYADPKADVLALVKGWLEGRACGRWLMVVDNADDSDVFFGRPARPAGAGAGAAAQQQPRLGSYIPECAHGAVLVTTRNKQAGLGLTRGRHLVEVGRMDGGEAEQLLRASGLGGDGSGSGELAALAARLEHLPLALVQAAAYIQKNSIPVGRYLSRLDAGDRGLAALLSEDFETVGRDAAAPRAVAETWVLSFEQIRQRDALAGDLLSFMSLLDRQAIPFEILWTYAERRWQQSPERGPGVTTGVARLEGSLGLLKAFCLVTEGRGYRFNMHRLVQLVTRGWLAQAGRRRVFEDQALSVVSRWYPPGNQFQYRARCHEYLPHALAVLKLQWHGSRREARARAVLGPKVAGLHLFEGQLGAAEKTLELAIARPRKRLGEDHPLVLGAKDDLTFTYLEQGRFVEAQALAQGVLEARERVVRARLARRAAARRGAPSHGQPGPEGVAAGSPDPGPPERVLGRDDPRMLTTISNLGMAAYHQNYLTTAETMARLALKASQEVNGADHPVTLIKMENLAIVLSRKGQLEEAEALQARVLEGQRRYCGEDHPYTLQAMTNLAFIQAERGRLDEAAALHAQALARARRALGDDSPLVATGAVDLAATLSDLGRQAEAEALAAPALAARAASLGDGHPNTSRAGVILAGIRRRQGRHAEAAALLRACAQAFERSLGPDHGITRLALETLASWEEEDGADAHGAPRRSSPFKGSDTRPTRGGVKRSGFALASLLARLGGRRETRPAAGRGEEEAH